MTTKSTKPLLDLSTLIPHIPIRIDGTIYKMASPGAFGIREINRMQKYGRLLLEFGMRDFSDEEADEMDEQIKRLVILALPDLPESVNSALTPVQRMEIAKVFFDQMRSEVVENPQMPQTEVKKPIGES